jgi:putative tryptophan/tyrosine transport system substrate-binding protein
MTYTLDRYRRQVDRMRRRAILQVFGLAVAAFPLAIRAQAQTGRIPVVGFLQVSAPVDRYSNAFRQGMREYGYVDGQSVRIEDRWAEGRADRLPELISDLLTHGVDVFVTGGANGASAIRRAVDKPVVVVGFGDPIASGLVASMAHPCGSVTGFSILGEELQGKQLEIPKKTVPGLARIGFIWNPDGTEGPAWLRSVQAAAPLLGIEIDLVPLRSADDLVGIERAAARGVRGLLVARDFVTDSISDQIIARSLALRMAAMFPQRSFADAGGLLSYGANLPDLYRRAADYVDKILKGTDPAELPIQQPVKFDFVVNLKTAKALGLTIPQTILARADEVIE